MLKNKILRKGLAVSLAAAMVVGTGFTTVGSFTGTNISVSAEELVEGDFSYQINDDNTVTVTKYNGSAKEVTVPDKIGVRFIRIKR